jgi:hypothetical protein
MSTEERFVLNDLPDNTWSVCWPGYENVLVTTPGKAMNLLKILFDEVGVDEAMIGVKEPSYRGDIEIMHINEAAWFQDREGCARHVVGHYLVFGCKFNNREQAEMFKLNLEKRLAWTRLSGNRPWE